MVEVKKYHLPPTKLIPNSPHPLLHYPGILSEKVNRAGTAWLVHDLLGSNGWDTHWIFRYGPTQEAHYHSSTHECMAVLSGTATIRFGVADTDKDLEASTYGDAREEGGILVEARAGDVFVLPAGLAHKTHNTKPEAPFALLTPGDGHGVDASANDGDVRKTLEKLELDGFTMLGAYPKEGGCWDFAVGGDSEGKYEKVWAVQLPEWDPILGKADEGLCGLWKQSG